MLESAVGIERHAQRSASRQIILGAIVGENRQASPGILLGGRPNLIGQPYGIPMKAFIRSPGQFGARLGHGAAVDRFGFGPQVAAAGVKKERTGLAVDALALTAGGQEQQEQKELGERELAPARKGLRRSGEGVRKTVRNY